MLALDVRSVRTGITTAIAAGVTLALLVLPSGHQDVVAASAMPAPEPEQVAVRESVATPLSCEDPTIQTVVLKGRVNASGDDDQMMTFHFRFAELPDRYTVMTGAHGEFEVRVSRKELGLLDLCALPTSNLGANQFRDAQLSIEYRLSFER